MFKSNLQELCNRRSWGLPKYSCSREGPDHSARYRASVHVNGVSIETKESFGSMKEATNEAARIAGSQFLSDFASIPDRGHEEEKVDTDSSVHDVDGLINGMRQYKSELQRYAQKNSMAMPMYSYRREGPSHLLRFKCTVKFDDQTFESPKLLTTIKEAENAAARVALFQLKSNDQQSSINGDFSANDSGIYKTHLQRFSQRLGDGVPIYKTVCSGDSQRPLFFSLVEVHGEVFHGKAARSKKQAEISVAKTAYTALKGRKLGLYVEPSSSTIDGSSAFLASAFKETKPIKGQDKNRVLTTEIIEAELAKINFKEERAENEGRGNSVPSMEALHLSTSSFSDDKTATKNITGSSLLCNRFRIYDSFPEHEFPDGITVLPISESQWVAVILDFPNEKTV